MPPEPLPWDRKDFVFRDRRPHDRGPVDALGRAGAGGSPGSFSAPRWREPPPFRGGGGGPRDFRAPSPRRPPPGHYKPFFSKEQGAHACPPPPPPPPPPDEENFRCYSGRYGSSSSGGGGGGGSGRDSARREARGHFQRSPPLNSADTPRRHNDSPLAGTAQRSVTATPQTPPPSAPTSSPSPSHLPTLKEHHDDKPVAPVTDGPATGGSAATTTTAATVSDREKDRDQDHSLGPIAWKPLKWTRSAGFSSSNKAASRSEPDDTGAPADASTQQQTTGPENTARALLASPTPSDEGQARKKQRLGWGQGLAKYEKQKVEGPEETSSAKNTTLVQCTTTTTAATTSSLNLKVTASDSSSKLAAPPGSASPTTPSSINCSSSKDVEDRVCTRTTSVDVASNLSDSPCHESQCFQYDFSLDLEHLNADSLIHISSMLAYVLQPEDTCSGDSKFTRQTAVNKLTAVKTEILKALEKTEAEIDTLENELKASSSEQDKQSKCQSEEDALLDTVTDIKPSSSCSDAVNDLVIQSALPSSEPFQNNICVEQCNGSEDQDIVINDVVTDKIQAIDTTDYSNPDSKELLLSACCDDDQSIIWRVPTTSEDDYMCNLIPHINSCNNKLASKASKSLNKDLLPNSSVEAQCSVVDSDLHVKKKIVKHKHSLHVKERILTLKFRILHHLWREDMHSLFVKKQRSKSQKRSEFGLRPTSNGSQKPRTSRLRLSPQGSSTLVPNRETVELASRLLSEPGNKMYTKYSSMPRLILDERERRTAEFASNKNGLVEDPVSLEKEKALINPWTNEEKNIFLEKLAAHGKDFKKVASFLDHKTTADCIEFYYKNHMSDSFESVKRALRLRKQEQIEQSLLSNDYMVETGKKWKREVSASSLDVLGAASAVVSHSNTSVRVQLDVLGAASAVVSHSNTSVRVRPKVFSRPVNGSLYALKTSSETKVRAKSTESPAEAAAANVLAGICSTISSEGVSCVTSSVDLGEKIECPVFSEVTQTIDEETCSDEGFGELGSGDWTDSEKSLFISALSLYRRDFARISHYVGTRSKEQCKIFYSKARKCLGLDTLLSQGGNGETPSSDANCGKSDLDDACLAEMDSAGGSIQSCSKTDIVLLRSTDKATDCVTTQYVNKAHDAGHREFNGDSEVGPIKEECETVLEVEQPLVMLGNNNNLCAEGKANQNEKIPEAAKLSNDLVEFKSPSDHVNGLMVNGTDLNSQVEQVSSVSHVTTVPVKHETVDSQHEDDRRNSFGNCLEVKLEAENLAEAIAVKGADKDELVQIGVSSVTGPCVDCNQTVTCFRKNDENQIELNLPPLPPKSTEMVPSEKQLGASTLPVDPLPLLTPFPSICLEGRPVGPPVSLKCEVSSSSHASYDKDVGEKTHFILGKQSMAQGDPSPSILSGFPLQSYNRERMIGDSGFFGLKSVEVEDMQKKSRDGTHKPLFRKEIGGGDKSYGSNNLTSCDLKPSIHFMPADALLRPCAQGSCSEVEEPPPVRTGDVKLFGKILSHPSSVPKPEEPDAKPSTSNSTPTNDITHLGFELGSGRNSSSSSRVLHQTNLDTAHFGLAEPPLRSYGFWDGQRIRTGFSSLPENAMLMPKYPEVLSGMTAYHQNNDGLSHASTSNNCFVIPQQRSFSVDDSGQNGIDELANQRTGVEAMQGFQQPGRVAMIVGGNMLVGGGACTSTGISDPVAALKMHYSMQNGLLGGSGSKEDSWKGDVGGR